MKRQAAKADLVSGLVLLVLGVVVFVESWRMPRFEHLAINPYTVPGLVPAVLGVVLACLGLALGVKATVAGGARGWRWPRWPGAAEAGRAEAAGRRFSLQAWEQSPTWRVLSVAGLTILYAGLLVAWLRVVPFWLATWVFVAAFIALFEWRRAREDGRLRRCVVTAVVQGLVVAIVVTLVFEHLFLVRLP